MMFRVLLLTLANTLPAAAALTEAELAEVTVTLPPNARFEAPGDRPAVLVFADFDCGALCDAIVGQTAQELLDTGLAGSTDLVVIGLDPRDGTSAAQQFMAAQAGGLPDGTVHWRAPNEAGRDRIAQMLGYGFAFDAENDRFAHPAARYVLTATGAVSRVLPAFPGGATDMRRALVEAGQGRVGSLIERAVLACYGFDPATGRYSPSILRLTVALGILTVAVLATLIGGAVWRERRHAT